MSTEFGKLDFAVGFNRTSAFPLDANSYFEDYDSALAAAATACEVGSADSAYYIGQLIIVRNAVGFGLYQISEAKGLLKFGQASSADELTERVTALEGKVAVIEGKLIVASATNDGFMSKEDFSKLAAIEENAQENKIESVSINGINASITDKKASIDNLYVRGQSIGLTNLTGTVNVVSGIKGDLGYDADTVSSTGTYTPFGSVAGTVKAAGSVGVTLTNNVINSIASAGTQAAFKEGAFTAATLTKSDKNFVTSASKISIDENIEECLVIDDAETDSASYIESFDGGKKEADEFTANALPTFEETTVGASAEFTGETSVETSKSPANIRRRIKAQSLLKQLTRTSPSVDPLKPLTLTLSRKLNASKRRGLEVENTTFPLLSKSLNYIESNKEN